MKRMYKLAESIVAAIAVAFAANTATAAEALSSQDKEFVKNAAEIGLTEVETGRLAEQKAGNVELKNFGARMVQDHEKSNQELMSLAKEKGVELKAEPSAAQRQMISALSGKSGAEFDKEYREHQIKDHQKAIQEFQTASREAKDPDIKAFATKNLPHLEHHLAMIEGGRGEGRTTEARPESHSNAPREENLIQRGGKGGRTEGQVGTER